MAGAWMNLILLGGLLGALGQSARAVVGLKKTYDAAAFSQQAFSDVFRPSVLLVSLLIGFVAGALGALATLPEPCVGSGCTELGKDALLALFAIGYAGTDFIEGFVRNHLPADPLAVRGRSRAPDATPEPDEGTRGAAAPASSLPVG